MKQYFPFTDYDFYAYLTSGALTLAVLDYSFNDSALLTHPDWTFVQIVAAIALAYVVGHIVATLSHLVLESFLVKFIIAKPMMLQLGFKKPNWFERLLGVLVGRYYEPLPESNRTKLLDTAAVELDKPVEQISDPEELFLLGFRKSFGVEGARVRIDDFRNQYGFCRNIAFVALAATGIVALKEIVSPGTYGWSVTMASGLVCVGMFVRYVKFLASFQSEVLRVIGK